MKNMKKIKWNLFNVLLWVWGFVLLYPVPSFASSMELQYAKGFKVSREEGYSIVTVVQPWAGAREGQQYLLVSQGASIPERLAHLPIVHVPVRRVITTSMTMLPFIEELGGADVFVGVGGKRYVYSNVIRNSDLPDVAADAGAGLRLDVEKILSLRPDVVFVYAYTATEKEAADRLRQLGVPLVIASDYLEEEPLGMAEWIKFVGLFLGEEGEADAFFRRVAERYNSLVQKVRDMTKERPTVMANAAIGGTWYVPGGRSWPAYLLRDAGGRYLWSDLNQRGGVPIDFENVLERAISCDFWINASSWQSLEDAITEDPRYETFRPFKERRIYNNNARVTKSGANDYYQQGIMRPDLILEDLIAILQPHLLPNHELFFYHQLSERNIP